MHCLIMICTRVVCFYILEVGAKLKLLLYTLLTLGPFHTRDLEPVTIPLQAPSLVEKTELVQIRFTLRLRDQRTMWMQDECKVYVDSYMASNGSCLMVTWTIFNNHLLQVGLTQNRKTMASHRTGKPTCLKTQWMFEGSTLSITIHCSRAKLVLACQELLLWV